MATVWLDRDECARSGDLPPVCMKCGAPAENYVRRTFSWYPPWVIVLIFVALIVWIIVSIILTKRMTVWVPMCDEHRRYFARRQAVGSVLVLLGFVALAGGIGLASAFHQPQGGGDWTGFLFAGGGCVFLVFLIAALIATAGGIKPTEITEYEIRLTGVSDGFADALEDQHQAERQERRERAKRRPARPRYDDDEDNPRPHDRYDHE